MSNVLGRIVKMLHWNLERLSAVIVRDLGEVLFPEYRRYMV